MLQGQNKTGTFGGNMLKRACAETYFPATISSYLRASSFKICSSACSINYLFLPSRESYWNILFPSKQHSSFVHRNMKIENNIKLQAEGNPLLNDR